MRDSCFWSPQCETKNRHKTKVYPRGRGGTRGNKTAISLEREESTGMDKKGQAVQKSDDSAVAKGRYWGRENILPAPFVRPLWMLSAPHMAQFVVRLIAIRKCLRPEGIPKPAHAPPWTTYHLTTCRYFKRRAERFAVRSRSPLTKSAMKSFPTTHANSTRTTSRRCWTSSARRVACAWTLNTTFLP